MKVITHYTKLGILLNSILEFNEIHLNSLENTNDPYEYKKRNPIVTTSENDDDAITKVLDEAEKVLLKKIKVGCFTSEPTAEIFDLNELVSIKNAPLWAHYGENNSGVAIVFDRDKLIEAIRNKITSDWALHHERVIYSDHITHSYPEIIDMNKLSDTSEILVAMSILNSSSNHWFRKDNKWSYEDEYRIMIYSPTDGPVKINISNSIVAIAFGEKVSKFLIGTLSSKLKERGIQCFSMEYDTFENKYVYQVT